MSFMQSKGCDLMTDDWEIRIRSSFYLATMTSDYPRGSLVPTSRPRLPTQSRASLTRVIGMDLVAAPAITQCYPASTDSV